MVYVRTDFSIAKSDKERAREEKRLNKAKIGHIGKELEGLFDNMDICIENFKSSKVKSEFELQTKVIGQKFDVAVQKYSQISDAKVQKISNLQNEKFSKYTAKANEIKNAILNKKVDGEIVSSINKIEAEISRINKELKDLK
jgi:D-hexose-6-phosphate mutarotase